MIIAQYLAVGLNRLAIELFRFSEFALRHKQPSHIVDGAKRVRMLIAQHAAMTGHGFTKERLGFGQLALRFQDVAHVVARSSV